jgi:hypothetical protein
MAGRAAHGHGGMNILALGFVIMALKAFGGVRVLVQRNRMNRGIGAGYHQGHQSHADEELETKPETALGVGRFADPNAMREHSHTASKRSVLHEDSRNAKRRQRIPMNA